MLVQSPIIRLHTGLRPGHRSSLRRAFTLVEILVVATVLPFVMISLSRVYATFIRDIPRTTRTLQQNTTVLDWLRQLRADMDRATGLPGQFEGQTAGARTVLIEQPGGVVRYQFEPGRVMRMVFVVTPSGVSSDALTGTLPTREPSHERLWRMRNAVITWRPWERDGATYAIEVCSHIEERSDGLVRRMLANSHVFFVHGFGQGSEAL